MRHLTIFLLIFSATSSFGQLYRPRPVTSSQRDTTEKGVTIRERLVQLALQNPQYEVLDRQSNIARYQLRIARNAPLGLLVASGNINEYTINKSRAEQSSGNTNGGVNAALYYPRYNFGLSIPFDIVSKTRNNIGIAKENLYITQAQKNDKFRAVKAEVLTKYEDYLMAKQLVDLQTKLTQDEYTLYKRTEKDFQDGVGVKLEDLDRSYKSYVAEQVKGLTLQRNLNVAKIDMERLIGVNIEEVERDYH